MPIQTDLGHGTVLAAVLAAGAVDLIVGVEAELCGVHGSDGSDGTPQGVFLGGGGHVGKPIDGGAQTDGARDQALALVGEGLCLAIGPFDLAGATEGVVVSKVCREVAVETIGILPGTFSAAEAGGFPGVNAFGFQEAASILGQPPPLFDQAAEGVELPPLMGVDGASLLLFAGSVAAGSGDAAQAATDPPTRRSSEGNHGVGRYSRIHPLNTSIFLLK